MIQSSTFLVCGTVQKCVLVKICSLFLFMSPFIDSIPQQFSCLTVPYLCFVSNSHSQDGPDGSRKHTKLPFPLTRNFLKNLCFTSCALTRCDVLKLRLCIIAKSARLGKSAKRLLPMYHKIGSTQKLIAV